MNETTVKLLPHQDDFLFAQEKFLLLIGGVGSGKTHAGSHYIIKRVMDYPKSLHFIGANTYAQLRDSTLNGMFGILSDLNVPFSYNQNQGLLSFLGGRVLCKSMENYNMIRGIEIASFWLDEVRDLEKDAFNVIMGRLRDPLCNKLEGRLTTSPAGFNWIYDYFDPSGEFHSPEFGMIKCTSYDNKHLAADYLQTLKSQYDELLFKQEVLGEFCDVQMGRAYTSYGIWNLSDENPFARPGNYFSPYLPVILGCDFNINPMSWTLGQNKLLEWYWFDEISLKQSDTAEASVVFAQKIIEMKDLGFKAEPNVIIVGDASGNAGSTKSAGQSDYDILKTTLKKYKITFEDRTPESNPSVKDRVNTVNARLRAADGTVSLKLHPKKCKTLKKDFERVSWKESATGAILDKTSDLTLTHSSDSIGYPICVLTPLTSSNEVGTLRIVRR